MQLETYLMLIFAALVFCAFTLAAILKSVNTLVYQGAQRLPKPSELTKPYF